MTEGLHFWLGCLVPASNESLPQSCWSQTLGAVKTWGTGMQDSFAGLLSLEKGSSLCSVGLLAHWAPLFK